MPEPPSLTSSLPSMVPTLLDCCPHSLCSTVTIFFIYFWKQGTIKAQRCRLHKLELLLIVVDCCWLQRLCFPMKTTWTSGWFCFLLFCACRNLSVGTFLRRHATWQSVLCNWFGVWLWKVTGRQEKRSLCHGVNVFCVQYWRWAGERNEWTESQEPGGRIEKCLKDMSRTCKQAHVKVLDRISAAVTESSSCSRKCITFCCLYFFLFVLFESLFVTAGEVRTLWEGGEHTHIHAAPSGRQLSCFSMMHRRDEYLRGNTGSKEIHN